MIEYLSMICDAAKRSCPDARAIETNAEAFFCTGSRCSY